jgi:hypothetical protein
MIPAPLASSPFDGALEVRGREEFRERREEMSATVWRLVVVGLGLWLGACAINQPVANVRNSPIQASKSNPTLDEIGKAITRAGAGLGWQMTPKGTGHMEGRLALRTHVAVVDVNYDRKSYSIVYKDSTNLDYDGSNIHRNYNGWIQNLDKAIKVQLANL